MAPIVTDLDSPDAPQGPPPEPGRPGEQPQFTPPSLAGRHVYLRPVSPSDYGLLQAIEVAELGVRWRLRGSTPSPEEWAQAVWQSVLAQFLIVQASDHQPLGIVMAYRPSFQDQHAYLAAAAFRPQVRSPLVMLGTALFIEYVFTCWDFRKLYLELPEFNLPQFASGLRDLFKIEGRFREHVFYDGRRWDQITMALYREAWDERSDRILAAETGPAERTVTLRFPERAGGDA